nr:macoA-Uk26 [Mamestra configurata nucleopolyhedrovirus A]
MASKWQVDRLINLCASVVPKKQIILLPNLLQKKIKTCVICKLNFYADNSEMAICVKCNYCKNCNGKGTLACGLSQFANMYCKCVNCATLLQCCECKNQVLFLYRFKWVKICNYERYLQQKQICEQCIKNMTCYDCDSSDNTKSFLYLTNVMHSEDGKRPLHRTVCQQCYDIDIINMQNLKHMSKLCLYQKRGDYYVKL